MTNFEMNISLFKISAYIAIGGSDPERQRAVCAEADFDVAQVSLERLFEGGPIHDHGKTHPMDKLLKSFTLGDNLDEWVKAGGSPLLATRHDGFPAYEYPPILGYLKSLLQVPKSQGLLRGEQFKKMSLKQWRLGTDDEMVASSLLRGLCTGVINSFDLDSGIPAALFDAFKNPVIEAQVIELLRASTFMPGEKCIFDNTESMLMTAYVFDRLGLNTLRQAVIESPAFMNSSHLINGRITHMLWATFYESSHSSMSKALQFLLHSTGIESNDPVIDQGLKGRFDNLRNASNREFVFERATRRMEYLIEMRALSQAGIWLKEALPHMDRFPEIPEEQKPDFIAACKIGEPASVMEALSVHGNQSLPFMIRMLGADGFLEAYKKTCERAASLVSHPVKGDTFISRDLIGLNVKDLKEHGLLHGVMDCLMTYYPQLFAENAKKFQPGKENPFVKLEFNKLTKWLGEALTAEPCNERAVAWFKRLEEPYAQEMFVAAMSYNKAVFREMSHKQRGDLLGSELGL